MSTLSFLDELSAELDKHEEEISQEELNAIYAEIEEASEEVTHDYETIDQAITMSFNAVDMLVELKAKIDESEDMSIETAQAHVYTAKVIASTVSIKLPLDFSAEEEGDAKPKVSLGQKIDQVLDTIMVKIAKAVKMAIAVVKNRFGGIVKLDKFFKKNHPYVNGLTGKIKLNIKQAQGIASVDGKVDLKDYAEYVDVFVSLKYASDVFRGSKIFFENTIKSLNELAEKGELDKLTNDFRVNPDGSTTTTHNDYVVNMTKFFDSIMKGAPFSFTVEDGIIVSDFLPGGIYLRFDPKISSMSVSFDKNAVKKATETEVDAKDIIEIFNVVHKTLPVALKRYKAINKELAGLQDHVNKTIKGAKFIEYTGSPARAARVSYDNIRMTNSVVESYVGVATKVGYSVANLVKK